MFKNILLPLDLTEKHQPALHIAVDLAQQSKGGITLLHVIELIPGIPQDEEKEFFERLERMAHAKLERIGSTLDERGIACRRQVLIGHRALDVARFAEDSGSDLIILTAPRFDPKQPAAGWGSMSYKVGMLASCPVLLVK